MDISETRLTVLFEDPFWVGLCERECGGRYEACRIVFGAEPRDCEVYDFVLKRWSALKFSPSQEMASKEERRINPKRMQREINKRLSIGVGTKAQQALAAGRELAAAERKALIRERRDEEKERQFALKQEKRKEKHRGH